MATNPVSVAFDAALHRAAWTMLSKEGMEGITRVHDRYLNVKPSTNQVEHELLYSGFNAVPQVANDTVPTPDVDFSISSKVTYRHNEYRQKYTHTKVAADDDQYGPITDVIGSMGESAAERIELAAADLFNNGTVAASYSDWNGDSLFNATHALVGSTTTYSNIAPNGSASFTTLAIANAYFKRILNDNGFWTPVAIEAIMCSPELAPLWRQILRSQSAYSTLALAGGQGSLANYGASGNDNPGIENEFRAMGLGPEMVIENPYLTNEEDTYFIGADKKINMYMREAPNTDTYNQDDPKAIVHRIQMRFKVGVTDGRRILQVPG